MELYIWNNRCSGCRPHLNCQYRFHCFIESKTLQMFKMFHKQIQQNSTRRSGPGLSSGRNVQLYLCPLPVKFILRPLIGPQIAWPVQDLSLVNLSPPHPPHPLLVGTNDGPNSWTHIVDTTHGHDLFTWHVHPTLGALKTRSGSGLCPWIGRLVDPTRGPELLTRLVSLTCSPDLWTKLVEP